MKKLVFVFAAMLLISCNQTKIAYIDVEVLMNEYKATKKLEEKLVAKQQKLAMELDSLQAPFQAKVQEYYKNATKMSAKKRSETEKALQQEQQMLQLKQQEASQALQLENQQNSEAITKKVDSFVATYAKNKGYKLILGTTGKGTVMYGDVSLDITPELIEILNSNYLE